MIGIFDSGLGGLTVARAIMQQLPGYDVIYFGDTARTPYGSKSPATVAGYALENTEFLIGEGAKIVVVACNSASSTGTDHLEEKYDLPIFEVISPAVDLSLDVSKKYQIGVIGTRATVNSGIYEKMIKKKMPDAKVYSASCPLLVPLVEEGWFKRPETSMIIKKYLFPLKVRQIDSLILGCTHYPLLKDIIQRKVGKRVNIIDSSFAVATRIKAYIDQHMEMDNVLTKNGNTRFFVSDITEQFEKIAQSVLHKQIHLEHVSL